VNKLSAPMRQFIRDYSAGAVASVNADGSPAVSPKATFVIVDDTCIAFGNIRSPGTVANLLERPAVEVSFIDVLARLALRVSGTAEVVARDSTRGRELAPHFEAQWAAYLDLMSDFVSISIKRAELITSPAYDVGFKREELVRLNLEKLSKLGNL
jgi:predicted pyridoxine 5'-phosphate oxidase superfamily flavin-nucleotide-binding protein